jgi:hypothetical protein
MRLYTVQGDLFKNIKNMAGIRRDGMFRLPYLPSYFGEPEVAIVHCISADAAMGAGFALQLVQKVGDGVRDEIAASSPKVGGVVFARGTFHMITKEHYWEKPTQLDFLCSLSALASELCEGTLKWIIMPRIGCGLDNLDWSWVRSNIERAFAKWDGSIIVCE